MVHYVLLNLYLVDSSFSNIKLKFFWLNGYSSDITKSAETYFWKKCWKFCACEKLILTRITFPKTFTFDNRIYSFLFLFF